MHQITDISLTNWKGETVSREPFERLTALIGPSGSGKTARLKALMYAFLGHCGDGKRNEDAADYVGARGGGVAVTMSDGFAFTRELAPTESGWSQRINIVGAKTKGVERAAGEIRARFGDFSPAMNPEEIVAMKAEKSRDFILDLCQSANTYDADHICRLVVCELLYQHERVGDGGVHMGLQAFGATPESSTLDQLLSIAESLLSEREIEALKEIAKLVLDGLRSRGDEQSEQIGAALDKVQEYGREAKADEKRGRLAAEEIMVTKNATAAVPGDIESLQRRAADLRAREADLIRRIESQTAGNSHLKTITDRIATIDAELKAAQDDYARGPIATIDVDAAEAERQILESCIVDSTREIEELERSIERLEGLRKQADGRRQAIELANTARTACVARIADLERQIAEVRREIGDETRSAMELDAEAELVEAGDGRFGAAVDALSSIERELTEAYRESTANETELEKLQTDYRAVMQDIAVAESNLAQTQSMPLVKFIESCCPTCRPNGQHLIESNMLHVLGLKAKIASFVEKRETLAKAIESRERTQSNHKSSLELIEGREDEARRAAQALERENSDRSNKAKALRDAADRIRKLTGLETALSNANAELVGLGLVEDPAKIAAEVHRHDADITIVKSQVRGLRETREAEQARLNDKTRAIDAARTAREQDNRRREELAQSIERLKRDKTEWSGKLNEITDAMPNLTVESMQTELGVVRGDISVADQRVRDKQAYLDLEANYSATLARANARGTAAMIADLAIAATKKVREHLLAALTKPVTALMTEFLEAYEPGLSAFIDLNKGAGESAVFRIGWIRNGRRIAIKTISGGERVVLTTALAYAVTLIKQPPLPILLVDACSLSGEFMPRFIEALEKSSDKFSNVVLAAHWTFPTGLLERWRLHELMPVMSDLEVAKHRSPESAEAIVF